MGLNIYFYISTNKYADFEVNIVLIMAAARKIFAKNLYAYRHVVKN